MLPAEIEAAAQVMFEETLRAQDFAHDGERLPRPVQAEAFRRVASKLVNLAVYIERTGI